jgi:hypothetical protein
MDRTGSGGAKRFRFPLALPFFHRVTGSTGQHAQGARRKDASICDYSSKLRPPTDTGSVEGIAGETGGQTDNGEEKPHAET